MLFGWAHAISFTDAMNREVYVEEPTRVVSLYNSYGDAWETAGGTLLGSIPGEYELSPGVQSLGSYRNPNLELLFSLEPDFVLLAADVAPHVNIAAILDEAGIPCAFFDTKSYRDYMEMQRIFASLTGREDLFIRQENAVRLPIEEIISCTAGLPKPSALLIRAHSTAVKARSSESTVAGAILKDMGFRNLADENSALCEGIGMEALLIEDPDYIFAVMQGTSTEAAEQSFREALSSHPAWNSLTAVREGRFYILDRELFHYHPNDRWAEAYAFMLDILEEAK